MYKFKYKRKFFWITKNVVGHSLVEKLDRLDLFLPDGSIHSVSGWSKCDMILGKDWKEAKEKMEQANK